MALSLSPQQEPSLPEPPPLLEPLPPVTPPVPAQASPPSPSISQTPASLTSLGQSDEWQIGDVGGARRGVERLPQQRRRHATAAVFIGVVGGAALVGGALAWRLGALDRLWPEATTTTTAPPPGPTATVGVSARLRIKTTPAGADVLDVSARVPRLLGITPLVVPWEVAPGDGPRTLELRLVGHVPAVARVEPPSPSTTGETVQVEVEAALRPLPGDPDGHR
jgi:hypothetical protein